MRIRTIFLGGVFGILTGCVTPPAPFPFIPKALEPQSRGITIAKHTPYNCLAVGSVEGTDSRINNNGQMRDWATMEKLREGALNDLRNNARDIPARDWHRIMLKIDKEIAICIHNEECEIVGANADEGDTQRKKAKKQIAPSEIWQVISYRIVADMYLCEVK